MTTMRPFRPFTPAGQVGSRSLFSDLLADRNAFGLFCRKRSFRKPGLWGSIPQSNSMADLIKSAICLPAEWEDVWRRG
jgi:hypothetical protein